MNLATFYFCMRLVLRGSVISYAEILTEDLELLSFKMHALTSVQLGSRILLMTLCLMKNVQGMDDMVVPPSVTDYIARVLPGSYVHKLPNEGHFSYLYFCDECHRQIFTTLFGSPQGPVVEKLDIDTTSLEGNSEEIATNA